MTKSQTNKSYQTITIVTICSNHIELVAKKYVQLPHGVIFFFLKSF